MPELKPTADPISSAITALLGPTNTGKTHRALERLLEHDTGIVGLPLRLLAREVYDKLSTRVGEDAVALVTGEEKRIPRRPRYWICTTESMPSELEVDFIAVDEIQLMSHPQRGHVFTDRLLRARGRIETWFLGSQTAEPLVRKLVPAAQVRRHPRLSELRHRGRSSLAGLPPRSAVVTFNTPHVYELADALRRRRGGAAVVLGALSPRARNAQVALYQSGEVEYLVATDAIGMGLNLDVDHVALASVRKFDGRHDRTLELAELGQIVGRAGRYVRDGSFGTLAPLDPLAPRAVQALETHRFASLESAVWRNPELDFASVETLRRSLLERPHYRVLRGVPDAVDFETLGHLATTPEVLGLGRGSERVQLLWALCQIPDYRRLSPQSHAVLVLELFTILARGRALPEDWVATRVEEVDRTDGDIHTLMSRIAAIRTWTYISNQSAWVERPGHWRERTRAIEDRLSDALHSALVARFVDRGSRAAASASLRRKPRDDLRAQSRGADGPFAKLWSLLPQQPAAGMAAAGASWIERVSAAPFEAFELSTRGALLFDSRAIARLGRGASLSQPQIILLNTEPLSRSERHRLHRRLRAWTIDAVRRTLGDVVAAPPAAIGAAARGLLYQLRERLGTTRTADAREQLQALTASDRRALQSHGLVFGQRFVYSQASVDAAALARRVALVSAERGDVPAIGEAVGARCFPVGSLRAPGLLLTLGYATVQAFAVRVDVLERAGSILRAESATDAATDALQLSALIDDERALEAVLRYLGYRRREGTERYVRVRPKRRRRRRRPKHGE